MHRKNGTLNLWDLDNTVLDSTHRQLTRPDGSLDLDHWREHCTREKILADTLLPMAHLMQAQYDQGRTTVVVCTSRVMQQHDFDLLQFHGLKFHHCLSRDENDHTSDAPFKKKLIQDFLAVHGPYRRKFLYDDNEAVISMACSELGILVYDSKILNRLIQNKSALGALVAARVRM